MKREGMYQKKCLKIRKSNGRDLKTFIFAVRQVLVKSKFAKDLARK